MPCYDCDKPYGDEYWIEAIVPDDVWNRIKPDGCADGCGILCLECIVRRLVQCGLKDVPMWFCGTEPFRVMAGDPSEKIELLRSKTRS